MVKVELYLHVIAKGNLLNIYKINCFLVQPGQKVEVSIVIEQEGNDFTIRKDVHVEFEAPERDIIEYETDPESESNTTLRPGAIPTGTYFIMYTW